MTELFIVIAIVCAAGIIFLPGILRPRHHCRVSCANNQKQIGLSFKCWALDNNDRFPFAVPVANGGTMELVSGGNVWPHFMVMSNELSTPRVLKCSEDPERVMANAFGPPASYPGYAVVLLTNDQQVGYFVGPDACNTNPSAILIGDRFLGVNGARFRHGLAEVATNAAIGWVRPWHEGGGNIGLADGSVQQATSKNLARLFAATGQATNRLVIP